MKLKHDSTTDELTLVFGNDDAISGKKVEDDILLKVNDAMEVRSIVIGKASKRVDLSRLETDLPLIRNRAD
jgi:uncharacterized protein YuzE